MSKTNSSPETGLWLWFLGHFLAVTMLAGAGWLAFSLLTGRSTWYLDASQWL